MPTRRERTRESRRKALAPQEGKIWSVQNESPKKLVTFKAGQKIPVGAQYLTFALKNDVPHLFFLVPESKKKPEKRTIGFRLQA